jgi:lysophospholipase L1-like esterase
MQGQLDLRYGRSKCVAIVNYVPRRLHCAENMKHRMTNKWFGAMAVLGGIMMAGPLRAQTETAFKFDFGVGKAAPGYLQVSPDMMYTAERGYGFEPGAAVTAVDRGGDDPLHAGFCTSDKPFLFSVKVPEGNYRVTVTLGDAGGESTTTIKAELRRLMVEQAHTAKGQFVTRSFTVNIRVPQIAGGGEVHLKDREKTSERAAWDDKLTLEFNGARPCLCAMEIARVEDAVTVYLLGDSTVCDQPAEPWASWGQMLPRFFKPEIAVANHAESGDSLKSSVGARRLDKILSTMKPGDYLFLQFGHNDQKEKGTNLAFTTYEAGLKQAIARTRERGGIPVLVTSMERKAGLQHLTLGDYPEAMRRVAKEENVPLIDLNAMSLVFYRALGADLGKAFQDPTHHNNYGSYELARCVVEGIRAKVPALAKYLADDAPTFDPVHPDSPESFSLPASPTASADKPLGN